MTPDTRARAATYMRGFVGPVLYAPDVPETGFGNDFRAAMHQLASLPNDIEARAAIHAQTQHATSMLYGTPMASEKPFGQVGSTAVIPISGALLNRFGGSYGFATGYNAIRSQMNAALGDESVTHILLDVNSPGGHVSGCMELAADILAAREQKPIMAYVDGLCCSAAYALASAASKIVVAPSAQVGSIGAFIMHVSFADALEKEGIEVTYVHAGKHKVDANSTEKLSADAKASLQAGVDATRDTFAATVEAGRGDKFSAKAALATEAKVFDGRAALALGMVDAVASVQAALAAFVSGDETPQQNEKAENMTVTSDATTTPPAAVAAAPDAAAIKAAERTRIAGITGHAEAAGRETLASHLALNTDMSVADAAAILAVSAKAAAAPAPAAATTDLLADAMGKTEQPNVGAGGEKSANAVNQMLSAYSAATGIVIEGVKH